MEMELEDRGGKHVREAKKKFDTHPTSSSDLTDFIEYREKTRGPAHVLVY